MELSWSWRFQAACRILSSEAFFPPEDEPGRARKSRLRQAKMICQICPVIEQCREYALGTADLQGVWGGLSEEERRPQVESHGV